MKRKFSGIKTVRNVRLLKGLWMYRSSFWGMIKSVLQGKYRLSFLTLVALILGIGYIFSPIDCIPDFIPVLGWMDDGLVFYFLLKRLLTETERWMGKRHNAVVVLPTEHS